MFNQARPAGALGPHDPGHQKICTARKNELDTTYRASSCRHTPAPEVNINQALGDPPPGFLLPVSSKTGWIRWAGVGPSSLSANT